MFCDIVCYIGSRGAPVWAKMLLVCTATEPMEVHVHGLGLFGLDGIVDNAKGCGVVGLDWREWLGMAHFDEEMTQWDEFMCIDV